MEQPWSAVVLAGGAGRRLGGVDKPGLIIRGRTLLDRVLAALPGAHEIVIVGPRRETEAKVRWTREPTPGSGPLAALAAGLDLITTDRVVLLAADLPQITPTTITRLRQAVTHTGAVLTDSDHHPQWLLSAWPTDLLRRALPADSANASLRGTLTPLSPVRVDDMDGSARDIDVPSDLDAFPE
ncbi:NTP transferase domain-containing protein [Actinokineospora auranticolor]|nr:NTP transferase domain-containing protein [Actinokineospora auranticolor]